MIINVKAKPNSGKQSIESFGAGRYLVYLKSPAENDKANIELINLLSKHLGVPASSIKIKTGRSFGEKLIEIK